MKKYKVYFTDNSKMKVNDLRLVQDVKIKKVKQRKFLFFWERINWQSVLGKIEDKRLKPKG